MAATVYSQIGRRAYALITDWEFLLALALAMASGVLVVWLIFKPRN
jgi:hypothetical protein